MLSTTGLLCSALTLRIQAALHAEFPRQEIREKVCSQCHLTKVRKLFAASQWPKSQPVCLVCKPVDAALQKKLLSGKTCSVCERVVDREGFSETQWKNGAAARCKECLKAALLHEPKKAKPCRTCKLEKVKAEFSTSQWQMPHATGSQCKACSSQRLQCSQDLFVAYKQRQPVLQDDQTPLPIADEEEVFDKAAAHRWLLNAPILALPSEAVKSFRAMHVVRGSGKEQQAPDKSGIPAEEKLKLLRACHEELSHMGGRDGLVKALKEEGKSWTNVALDAQWVVNRCEDCRKQTTRDTRKPQPRHLPTPGCAGEVIGFDLKTVTPHNSPKWLMLLAVDFSSKKCFAWDLDYGNGDLPTVQDRMLRFFCEQELPLVVWTDNGGPFRNVIQCALEKSIGVKPRHIPPGRPQANGLVEVYNRILDSAHGGQRERLLAAVVAYNHMPQARFGAAPETLWRVLRPAHSRWRNLQIGNMLHGPNPGLTDEEWLKYLCAEDAIKEDHYKQAADKYHEALQPVQDAMASKHLRQNMQRAMRYNNKRTQSSDAPLLSGDRVIAKNTQYTTKTGKGKFETKDGEVREYIVLSVSQGFAQLEEIATGHRMMKHEANLKLMPSTLEHDDSNVCDMPLPHSATAPGATCAKHAQIGPFLKIPTLPDGACLYRSFNLALQHMAGVGVENLVDDDSQAQAVRSRLLLHMQLWLRNLTPADRQEAEEKTAFEMSDDPTWLEERGHEWNWDAYFAYAGKPKTFGTFANVASFVRYEGLTVEIHQPDDEGNPKLVWCEHGLGDGGAWRGGPVRLLRTGQHYDLLLPNVPSRRVRGKCPPAKRARFDS